VTQRSYICLGRAVLDGSSTDFATIERASRETIYESFSAVSNKTLLPEVLDAIPNICIIINQGRQIVFANRALLTFMGADDQLSVCGLRPGEALSCLHADETPAGCGTTDYCEICGSANAISRSNEGHESSYDCRMTRHDGQVLDLRVWTTPLSIEGKQYTVMTMVDVSDEKRRRMLERVFFHDILNTAGAIRGFCELLTKRPPDQFEKVRSRIERLSTRLIAEIDAQKALTDAENKELFLDLAEVETDNLLFQVVDQHGDGVDSRNPVVEIDPKSDRVVFKSDPALLRRVIGNLLKNAIEASGQEEAVTIGSYRTREGVEFRVHNKGSIPRDVQLQVFQRSFSTKGTGRGLGTYSAKLLTERYLKGKISFASSPESGTTFKATYPLDLG
jgi:K+-sensing histidine kinase KdpD